ncbi:MAG TPA: gamma-glutamyl-gamma-aminobutyrate hydrolase family protein [Tepidisphaeraceae bacterium]|nr:gamma-glutamyl-gamma-aminobutyrate hydrolase family protein [Tepidisphaeraceae bacterium]
MSQAIILQHVPYETPGRIVPVFRDFGIPVEIRHLYKGDEVPTDLDELRVLVVMGGPMGVKDLASPQYPFLAKEVELLQRLIAADRPVLGICLGAQLLAHAAGAKVYPNTRPGATPADAPIPAPEIGWGPVNFPFPGGTDPLVLGLMDGAMMFHWHFDTFDLPRLPTPPTAPPGPPPPTGNVLLSSSRACKNQAFRFKQRLFGFQYHFELTEVDIEAMVMHDQESWKNVLGPAGNTQIREQTARYYPKYARLGERVLNNFVQFLRAY